MLNVSQISHAKIVKNYTTKHNHIRRNQMSLISKAALSCPVLLTASAWKYGLRIIKNATWGWHKVRFYFKVLNSSTRNLGSSYVCGSVCLSFCLSFSDICKFFPQYSQSLSSLSTISQHSLIIILRAYFIKTVEHRILHLVEIQYNFKGLFKFMFDVKIPKKIWFYWVR